MHFFDKRIPITNLVPRIFTFLEMEFKNDTQNPFFSPYKINFENKVCMHSIIDEDVPDSEILITFSFYDIYPTETFKIFNDITLSFNEFYNLLLNALKKSDPRCSYIELKFDVSYAKRKIANKKFNSLTNTNLYITFYKSDVENAIYEYENSGEINNASVPIIGNFMKITNENNSI